ncbi:MAG TPA: OsmC family protein [Gemmatimonadales bacterium]|nr:OsmC family protein [Gemmatimonadales bacterium]
MAQETKHVALEWRGDLRFEGGLPEGPAILIDGDNAEGPGPMATLLLAAASCSAADVVIILKKMQTTLEVLRIEVAGVRRETEPRRYLSIHLVYHLKGTGIDEPKARRAIDLSIEKYCSVMHSLAADIAITYDLRVG